MQNYQLIIYILQSLQQKKRQQALSNFKNLFFHKQELNTQIYTVQISQEVDKKQSIQNFVKRQKCNLNVQIKETKEERKKKESMINIISKYLTSHKVNQSILQFQNNYQISFFPSLINLKKRGMKQIKKQIFNLTKLYDALYIDFLKISFFKNSFIHQYIHSFIHSFIYSFQYIYELAGQQIICQFFEFRDCFQLPLFIVIDLIKNKCAVHVLLLLSIKLISSLLYQIIQSLLILIQIKIIPFIYNFFMR
ncbi:transmembrane protein, putative (macronuclear) [Tetrahymena thermophila SB210]|uniref:Transmembrane protein, putative n=1 Tax=Tetrahymena thermophila (strain SB210) TaxID=312017 RepID=W7WWL6_TETTS|nr:transmembrane protein, putative [Tetrahymena thermophila SB210]EWS71205.1 transmembrane protein, putative [Tetrahymena thermophila SB210]|eukprot:XP_012656258.1 transmembrane protein, putative [Tetrahymena thermophila SB210]